MAMAAGRRSNVCDQHPSLIGKNNLSAEHPSCCLKYFSTSLQDSSARTHEPYSCLFGCHISLQSLLTKKHLQLLTECSSVCVGPITTGGEQNLIREVRDPVSEIATAFVPEISTVDFQIVSAEVVRAHSAAFSQCSPVEARNSAWA